MTQPPDPAGERAGPLHDAGARDDQRHDAPLRAALARAREERDEALRQALDVEQQRDLARELALRFEHELDQHRREFARALNDEIAGKAMAVKSMAATFESRLAEREPSLAQLAALLVSNADALLTTVGDLVRRARPQALEQGGLADGLRALLDDWRLRQPGLRFELLLAPDDADAFVLDSPLVESAAYRIVEEAIGNAVTHAGAATIVVSARRGDTALTLQVSDDGCGLPRGHAAEGTGLRRMRERAQAAGGSLTVATGESGGVEVLVRLPWPGVASQV